jgi:acetyltransferase-like isoleucine patch superfamily enzyme
VSKDVPSCAIIGGNPAKIIGYRDENEYKILKDEGAFY